MNLRRRWFLWLFFVSCSLLRVEAKKRNIKDPMIDLLPFDAVSSPTQDIQVEEFDVESAALESTSVPNNQQQPGVSNKRDVDGNIVTISEASRQNIHRFYVERGELRRTSAASGGDHSCSFTYVLPESLPSDSEVCIASHTSVRATTGNRATDNLREIYNQVMVAKSQMEIMRNEIVRQQGKPARELASIKRDVDYLKQETRVGNERVAQLHTQLVQEIVNKRDHTIEIRGLENRLLNHTIKHLLLRDEHGRLQQSHTALQGRVSDLEGELASLRRAVERLTRPRRPEPCRNNPPRETAPTQDETNIVTSRVATQVTEAPPSRAVPFRDCSEIQERGFTESGVYALRLPSMARKMRVWCDLEQDPGGWIIIQRRTNSKVSFKRNMASYKKGFGKLRGDFWLGLENIHKLTSQAGKNYKLHIDLEDWQGKKTFVEYRSFRVENEENNYRLRIAHYTGNAGDSLTWHNNMSFTTEDVDNDPFDRNCATYHKGGWWYNTCAHSNLNGVYYKGGHYHSEFLDGIYWSEWRGGTYSLKSVSMMIRPTD